LKNKPANASDLLFDMWSKSEMLTRILNVLRYGFGAVSK